MRSVELTNPSRFNQTVSAPILDFGASKIETMRAYLIRCPDGAGLIAADEAIAARSPNKNGDPLPRCYNRNRGTNDEKDISTCRRTRCCWQSTAH